MCFHCWSVSAWPSARSGAWMVVLSGLTNEIVVNLVKFNGLIVIAEDGNANTNEADTTYTLQGSIRLEPDDMRAIARLVRGADGAVVWSSDYDVNIKGRSILDAQMAIARSITAAVAAPVGAGAEGPVMPKVGTGSVRS